MKSSGASGRRARAIAWAVLMSVGVVSHAAPPPQLEQQRREMEVQIPGLARQSLPRTRAGDAMRWVVDAINAKGAGEAGDAITKRFTPDFLEFASAQEIAETFRQIREETFEDEEVIVLRIAPGERDDNLGATIGAAGAEHALDAFLLIDEDSGLITGLRFTPTPGPGGGGGGQGEGEGTGGGGGGGTGWDALSEDLDELDGDIVFGAYQLVDRLDQTGALASIELLDVAGKNETVVMNVGQASALYVLGALAREVVEGKASWGEELAVREDLRSLPPGSMQLLEPGTRFPLSHYAMEMMNTSDNTAMDHLLARLTRRRVEQFVEEAGGETERNRPFLSTREAFLLKLEVDESTLRDFADAIGEVREEMLGAGGVLAGLGPRVESLGTWEEPIAVEQVGWFASPRQLCEVLTTLETMRRTAQGVEPVLGRLLAANPGLALDAAQWTWAGFKGGSEPGVTSGAWLLRRSDGVWFAFSVVWNNRRDPIENDTFVQTVRRAVGLLAEQGKPAAPKSGAQGADVDPEKHPDVPADSPGVGKSSPK